MEEGRGGGEEGAGKKPESNPETLLSSLLVILVF